MKNPNRVDSDSPPKKGTKTLSEQRKEEAFKHIQNQKYKKRIDKSMLQSHFTGDIATEYEQHIKKYGFLT